MWCAQVAVEWHASPERGINADHRDQHDPPHSGITKLGGGHYDGKDDCGGCDIPDTLAKVMVIAMRLDGRNWGQQIILFANMTKRHPNRFMAVK